ncbi:MAG: hypothetical protein DRP45_01300 [Candidatus Zixiibacteriota bacterium]|nr:MAG: hypothetical protein DRP45_01300 [candidate division Zixibacteria bacterium]
MFGGVMTQTACGDKGVLMSRKVYRFALGAKVWAVVGWLVVLPSPLVAEGIKIDLELEEMRQRGESEGWTFTVKRTPYTNREFPELWADSQSVSSDITPRAPLTGDDSVPFAWRYDEMKDLPYARDQGSCGSCWAFATIGAMECATWVKEEIKVDLSEQHLINCNVIYDVVSFDCDGGREAYETLTDSPDKCFRTGVALEEDVPYAATDTLPCDCSVQRQYWLESWDYVCGYPTWSLPNLLDLKQAIRDYGPVSVAIKSDGVFQSYSSGVFNDWSTDEGFNHMLLITGWNDSLGANGAWRVRNSWGRSWGYQGYGWIEYGCRGVGAMASYIVFQRHPDADGDSIENREDNCVWVANPNQGDTDLDTRGNACDNCPDRHNLSQADRDGDGIGDACCCILPTVGDLDRSGEVPPQGNVDAVDLMLMVDILFATYELVGCPAEADIDLSGRGEPDMMDIDGADLSLLVNHLYITFEPLPACP